MKKGAKFLVLLLCAIFAFTSCDAAIGFMAKMGQNIMGTDTSKADKAAESATVSDDAVTSAEEDDRINKPSDNTTTTATIKLSGVEITVSADDVKNVNRLLPAIENSTISDIASAIKTQESTAKLVTEMSQPATAKVTEGAKGTATVMKAVLDKYVKDLGGETTEENSTMTAVKNAISSLSSTLNTIATGKDGEGNDVTVTKGDVVTLQLIENFATQVAASVDDSGAFKEESISGLLSSANTLATVTTSLSDASKFELNLSSLISDAMGLMNNSNSGDESATGSISTRDSGTTEQETSEEESGQDDIIKNIEDSDLTEYAGMIRTVYSEIKKVIGSDATKSVSTLSLHKGSYETYVSVASHTRRTGDRAFKAFASYDGLIKYTVASALSEVDRYYKLILANKDNLGLKDVDLNNLPASIWEILKDFEKTNQWLLKATNGKVTLDIPQKYEGIIKSISQAFDTGEEVEATEDKFVELIRDNSASTISALETIDTMLDVVNLSDILSMVGSSGSNDIASGIQAAIDWFNNETSTGTTEGNN